MIRSTFVLMLPAAWFFIVACCEFHGLEMIASAYSQTQADSLKPKNAPEIPPQDEIATVTDQPLTAMQNAVFKAIERVGPSVVAIARVNKNELADPTSPLFVPKEFGTGVAIDSSGLILTCYHVLGNPVENDYYVWIAGVPFQVREVQKVSSVIGADPWTDLAVLKIDAKLQPIQLASKPETRVGAFVISLGNPMGIARDGRPSASFGIISNRYRKRSFGSPSEINPTGNEAYSQYGTLLQTDAVLTHGLSGGPLVNLQGEMIGLTSSLAADDRFSSAAGFAIPVDQTFIRTVEKLKRGRSVDFGFLGIATRELALAERQQFQRGVMVTQVVENTPADICGLQFGDVITHVDGSAIQSSSEMLKELSGKMADDEISITVRRRPFPNSPIKSTKLKVKLGKRKIRSSRPTIGINDISDWRGLKVDYPTAVDELALHYQKIDPKGCVAIVGINKGSPAAVADLQTNQFITHVGESRVSNPQQFYDAVRNLTGDVTLKITSPTKELTRIIKAPK